MEIRKRITIQFITIVAFITGISSLAIYVSFAESRKEEFYDRLSQKAQMVAQMLIDIDEIDTDLLQKIEQRKPLSLPNEKIKIYDYNNTLIFTSDTTDHLNYTEDQINKVRLEGEIQFRRGFSQVTGYFYTGQYDRIVVFVAANDIFGLNKLKRLRIILIIVFFSSLIIIFFFGRFFADRSLQPITMMMKQLDNIEAAELSVRLNTGKNEDEIAKLAMTFNRFLHRLESAIKVQRNFIANASHELKTPLAVLSGQLEVLLRKERTNKEYRETVAVVFDEIKNLSLISNRLLLLAHASSETSNMHFYDCRVDDIIWKAQSELKKRHADYTIQVLFADDFDSPEKLTIQGNEILLTAAFVNLMDNACKYSKSKTCKVKLNLPGEANILLEFEDSGIGIAEKDIKNIFQPFYRSEDVIHTKGHGIGLSLVEKIVVLHNGTIKLNTLQGKGSTFSVVLNLKV